MLLPLPVTSAESVEDDDERGREESIGIRVAVPTLRPALVLTSRAALAAFICEYFSASTLAEAAAEFAEAIEVSAPAALIPTPPEEVIEDRGNLETEAATAPTAVSGRDVEEMDCLMRGMPEEPPRLALPETTPLIPTAPTALEDEVEEVVSSWRCCDEAAVEEALVAEALITIFPLSLSLLRTSGALKEPLLLLAERPGAGALSDGAEAEVRKTSASTGSAFETEAVVEGKEDADGILFKSFRNPVPDALPVVAIAATVEEEEEGADEEIATTSAAVAAVCW